MPGILITLEGIEGAGKSTLVPHLAHYCHKRGYAVVVSREPGGTIIAEEIRKLLLTIPQHSEALDYKAELLLLFASRAQHIAQIIQPAITAGKLVICDRFIDASYAYQHYARGLDYHWLHTLEALVVASLVPHTTILLDLPPQVGLQRSQARQDSPDRFEQENIEFFTAVRNGYLARAAQEPQRFVILNAEQDPATIQAQAIHILQQRL